VATLAALLPAGAAAGQHRQSGAAQLDAGLAKSQPNRRASDAGASPAALRQANPHAEPLGPSGDPAQRASALNRGRDFLRRAESLRPDRLGGQAPSLSQSSGQNGPKGWPAGAIDGELLVTTTGSLASAGMRAFAAAGNAPGLQRARARGLSSSVSEVTVPPGQERAAAASLAKRPDVVAVEPVRVRRFTEKTPNDPHVDQQWAHRLTGVKQAWETTTGSSDVEVALLDSGVVGSHPDLEDNLVVQADASSGEVQERQQVGVDNDPCGIGHGTLTAGVVGAVGDNGRAVAGVNWDVSLVDISLSSPSENQARDCKVPDDAVIAGMDWAVDEGVDVINLSFGAPQSHCPRAYQEAIDNARNNGVVVVAASGNSGQRETLVPASCEGVISVGGVGRSGEVAGYSTTNDYVDLSAPGGDSVAQPEGEKRRGLIRSTARGDCTGSFDPPENNPCFVQGTSFASPYVAGAAALLLSQDPSLSVEQVASALQRTAKDEGLEGRDDAHGWGLVQLDAAVERVASSTAVPPPRDDGTEPFPVGDGSGSEGPTVSRVTAGTPTKAVPQAVAVSKQVFPENGAEHVVLARKDDYADALAGSALGFGVGPLLFSSSFGPLPEATKQELRRVLEDGGTVYLLGGPVALSESIEQELADMGYQPTRLSGETREETAVAVAEELRQRLPEMGFANADTAIVATRGNWPDAVTAGSLAAYFGVPILLTPPDELHPATGRALEHIDPNLLYVVGGKVVVDEETAQAASEAAQPDRAFRLAGAERTETAVAVAAEVEFLFSQMDYGRSAAFAVATNLRRSDGFAHVLSASAIPGAFGGVFAGVEGTEGTKLTGHTSDYLRGLGIDGVLDGGTDLVTNRVGARIEDLLGQ
jgi:subtilisin family serine protease/putative cell wall-binding protein